MSKPLADLLLSVVLFAFALSYYREVQQFKRIEEAMSVMFLFWLLIPLLAAKAAKAVRELRLAPKPLVVSNFASLARNRAFLLVFLLVLYWIFLPVLGFFTSSFLSMASLMYLLGSRRIAEIVATPLCLLGFIYVSFVVLLGVRLPRGLFF